MKEIFEIWRKNTDGTSILGKMNKHKERQRTDGIEICFRNDVSCCDREPPWASGKEIFDLGKGLAKQGIVDYFLLQFINLS